MIIKIICIGKLKEKFLQDGCNEYIKRLKPFAQIVIDEIKEDGRDNIEKEGKAILERISPRDYVIALDLKGKMLTSVELSKKIDELTVEGISNISFIIGGSNGISEEVLRRSDMNLSFSKMTFTHQMIRMFLLEQIYRGYKISRNEPYHK